LVFPQDRIIFLLTKNQVVILRHFILNTKNYPEVAGQKFDKLIKIVSELSSQNRYQESIQLSLAPPAFSIGLASSNYPALHLLAQHVDDAELGATTGFLPAEMAKSFGAKGSLVNHSEHRISENQVVKIVSKLRELHMVSIVCARDDLEVEAYSRLAPDFIAIEPPELIGSGIAVSKARPELIKNSRRALELSKPRGSSTRLICGAGIVDGIDSKLAIELGAEGILVASGVIKSPDWKAKISELADGIISAREPQVR
jgi:triosephosphate isomerase